MNNKILCVVCTRSLDLSKKLLNSFDRQECCNYTLHVASYRRLDEYPPARQLLIYSPAARVSEKNDVENKAGGGDNISENIGDNNDNNILPHFSGRPEYIIFVNEGSELYGTDFITKLIEPLEKDGGILFSIPATILAQENLSFYQLNLSCAEKKYGIAMCNIITGFSPDKYEIFTQLNIMAVAMRYKTYVDLQAGCDFITNPVDFNFIPELMKRRPQCAVIAPQCAAFLPEFSNFTDLWKLFYNNARRNAWFNYNSGSLQIKSNQTFKSFYTIAYSCGLIRQYFHRFSKSRENYKR